MVYSSVVLRSTGQKFTSFVLVSTGRLFTFLRGQQFPKSWEIPGLQLREQNFGNCCPFTMDHLHSNNISFHDKKKTLAFICWPSFRRGLQQIEVVFHNYYGNNLENLYLGVSCIEQSIGSECMQSLAARPCSIFFRCESTSYIVP